MRKLINDPNQLSIFDLFDKPVAQNKFIMWKERKLNSSYWENKAKDHKYLFNEYPLFYIHLPAKHGIKLFMFNPMPFKSKGSYDFDGFEYKGKYYLFSRFHGSWKKAKYEQYWWQLLFWYNSISPHLLTWEIEYICRKIKEELHGQI